MPIALATLLCAVLATSAEPAPQQPPPQPPSKADSERAAVEDDDYRVSLSLPTEDDRAAWLQPGLRIELSVERGLLFAHGPAPRIGATAFELRPRLRLDRLWSIAATFSYGLAGGEFTGTRWTALVEPIFHPTPSLGVSLAVGYGGLSVSRASGDRVGAASTSEIASRTLSDTEQISECSGGAWVWQARGEYLFVVGPLFATGPYVAGDAQWTGCTESFGKTDRETGHPALGRQWWLSLGGAVGWWFSWR
jgi:hypothetical protein